MVPSGVERDARSVSTLPTCSVLWSDRSGIQVNLTQPDVLLLRLGFPGAIQFFLVSLETSRVCAAVLAMRGPSTTSTDNPSHTLAFEVPMSRSPFQVLVMPFHRLPNGDTEFLALRRADDGRWQGVAGGGEEGESPEDAALREASEELGFQERPPLFRLESRASIPVHHFPARPSWPSDLLVIPEYSFALDCTDLTPRLSEEHTQLRWGSYETCSRLFTWDSNRTALWELRELIGLRRLSARRVKW